MSLRVRPPVAAMPRRTVVMPCLASLVAGVLLACEHAPTTMRPGVAGTYRLVAMNGAPVPGTVAFGPVTQDVQDGALVLGPDRRYAHSVRLDGYGYTASGSYELAGSTIVLQPDGSDTPRPPTLSGRVWPDSVAITGPDGVHWSFRRVAAPR